MRGRTTRLIIAGLIALLMVAGVPGVVVGQTPEPGATATPLPSATPLPTNTPPPTNTVSPTSTPTVRLTAAPTATARVVATAVPVTLPVTGRSNTTKALAGLAPVIVLLLLALPALGRLRAGRR